ncbi:MAG: LLM class flavin-dependent oxidoreductase, partial [Chloroflexota bacterium]
PLGERFDRFESAIGLLQALFAPEARQAPGVSRDDRVYPLRGATLEPPPVHPGGPPLWLGVEKPRGIRLAARYASGWPMPGTYAGDVGYFRTKRDEIRRALEAAGRDPTAFTFAAQLNVAPEPADLRAGRETALAFRAVGADHVIIGVPGQLGPPALAAMAAEVAEPLREAWP